jgi:PAS domain S-box-containing protein
MIQYIICYLLKINDAFTSCLGYTKKDLVGKSALDFIHPDDLETTINST